MNISPSPSGPTAPTSRVAGRFGVGREDITPNVGHYFRSWGAALKDNATGVHRPFVVTVLTLRGSSAAQPLVLAAVDGGWWQSSADERFVRDYVLEQLGLSSDNLMINLSHTHAGPSLVRDNADRPGGEHIEPYLKRIREAIVSAARTALATEAGGELRWAVGRSDLATNRGLRDPEKPRYVTGYNPGAAADDTLLVGRITTGDGRVLGTIMNYACHPTTLAWDNESFSPDYVGAAREVLETATGAPCVFLLGACGDLAPAYQYVGDVSVPDAHGERLGTAALATLKGMLPHGHDLAYEGVVESGAPLAVWRVRAATAGAGTSRTKHTTLRLPIKTDYPRRAVIEEELAAATEPFLRERLTRKLRLRRTLGDDVAYAFEVWAWRFGSSVFVGYPGEAFSELQVSLRERFPANTVVVMNLVNGSIGYVPPLRFYGEDMYEVWQTPLDKGCLESLHAACVDAITDLTKDS